MSDLLLMLKIVIKLKAQVKASGHFLCWILKVCIFLMFRVMFVRFCIGYGYDFVVYLCGDEECDRIQKLR